MKSLLASKLNLKFWVP